MILTGSWDQDLCLWNVKDLIKWKNLLFINWQSILYLKLICSHSSLSRIKTIKFSPLINKDLTFKNSVVVVVQNELILCVYDKFSSTWFCQKEFIHFASILRENQIVKVASIFQMLEINVKYLSRCLMPHFIKASLNFPLDKVEPKENHLFFGKSFFMSVQRS